MDVDIDLPTKFDPTKIFPKVVLASMIKDGHIMKHPCGAYFQNIGQDPISKVAAIPYKEASAVGFMKIDFLHLGILDDIASKQQIRELIKVDPNWNLLLDQHVVEQLFHIKNHFSLINSIKPKSIQDLADCMALIRPNKRQMLREYLNDRDSVRPHLYRSGTDDKSSFKLSHAIAYAHNIVIQLHLIAKAHHEIK